MYAIDDQNEGRSSVAAFGAGGAPSLSNAKAQEAYFALRQAIEEARVLPGAALKEVQLARDLGMSRTPVREALKQLHHDGLVTLVPNRGAVVRTLSARELDDIYTLRAVLEGFCASRAATRMDVAAIAQLAELHAEFDRQAGRDGEDVEPLIRLNAAFHHTIVAGSRNRRAADLLRKLMDVPLSLQRAFWRSRQAREIATVYHAEIVEAIRARDAVRAEAVMRSHVYAVKDTFIQQQSVAGIHNLLEDALA